MTFHVNIIIEKHFNLEEYPEDIKCFSVEGESRKSSGDEQTGWTFLSKLLHAISLTQ